jgi:hypothetical protein
MQLQRASRYLPRSQQAAKDLFRDRVFIALSAGRYICVDAAIGHHPAERHSLEPTLRKLKQPKEESIEIQQQQHGLHLSLLP